MKHTLSSAARATAVSRSTIHRAIKSGKLSASKNEEGEYRIDPAELHRVYPAVPERPTSSDVRRSETSDETSVGMASDLLEMVQEKDTKLTQLQTELDDTKERLNEHREAAKLLVDPETHEAKKAEWEKALAARKVEIDKARAEAAELGLREQEQAKALKAEQAKVAALESRGFIARLFNKKIESGEAV